MSSDGRSLMHSMTGFGAGSADVPGARIAVEVRGVNQRHLDIRIAAPREYAAWESELRERMRAQVARGRVDVTVVRTPVAARRRYRVAARGTRRRIRQRGARARPPAAPGGNGRAGRRPQAPRAVRGGRATAGPEQGAPRTAASAGRGAARLPPRAGAGRAPRAARHAAS